MPLSLLTTSCNIPFTTHGVFDTQNGDKNTSIHNHQTPIPQRQQPHSPSLLLRALTLNKLPLNLPPPFHYPGSSNGTKVRGVREVRPTLRDPGHATPRNGSVSTQRGERAYREVAQENQLDGEASLRPGVSQGKIRNTVSCVFLCTEPRWFAVLYCCVTSLFVANVHSPQTQNLYNSDM